MHLLSAALWCAGPLCSSEGDGGCRAEGVPGALQAGAGPQPQRAAGGAQHDPALLDVHPGLQQLPRPHPGARPPGAACTWRRLPPAANVQLLCRWQACVLAAPTWQTTTCSMSATALKLTLHRWAGQRMYDPLTHDKRGAPQSGRGWSAHDAPLSLSSLCRGMGARWWTPRSTWRSSRRRQPSARSCSCTSRPASSRTPSPSRCAPADTDPPRCTLAGSPALSGSLAEGGPSAGFTICQSPLAQAHPVALTWPQKAAGRALQAGRPSLRSLFMRRPCMSGPCPTCRYARRSWGASSAQPARWGWDRCAPLPPPGAECCAAARIIRTPAHLPVWSNNREHGSWPCPGMHTHPARRAASLLHALQCLLPTLRCAPQEAVHCAVGHMDRVMASGVLMTEAFQLLFICACLRLAATQEGHTPPPAATIQQLTGHSGARPSRGWPRSDAQAGGSALQQLLLLLLLSACRLPPVLSLSCTDTPAPDQAAGAAAQLAGPLGRSLAGARR